MLFFQALEIPFLKGISRPSLFIYDKQRCASVFLYTKNTEACVYIPFCSTFFKTMDVFDLSIDKPKKNVLNACILDAKSKIFLV